MKRLLLLLIVALGMPQQACASVAKCAVTGVVYDGAGNPVPNASIYFNSQNTQIVGGNTIYASIVNSTTDANGNLSTTALAQGLFVQITICQAQGGGCGAATTGFVPVTTTTTFQNLLAGQAVSIGTSLSGNLNASGYRITNLGANTTLGDALSQGVSHLGDLATNNANYNFGGFKLQNLGAGATSGDAMVFQLNDLSQLAAATGNYNMNSNKLTGLVAGSASGDSIAFGLNDLSQLATATGNYSMGLNELINVSTLLVYGGASADGILRIEDRNADTATLEAGPGGGTTFKFPAGIGNLGNVLSTDGSTGATSWKPSPLSMLTGSSNATVSGATPNVFPISGNGTAVGTTSEGTVSNVSPFAGTLTNLECVLTTAAGVVTVAGGTNYVVAVRQNLATTALTCTILATASSCQDAVDHVTVAVGDQLDYIDTPSGTPTALVVKCAVQVTQ